MRTDDDATFRGAFGIGYVVRRPFSEEIATWLYASAVSLPEPRRGMAGMMAAAKQLWPELSIETSHWFDWRELAGRGWSFAPAPLMTTTGYALSWYTKGNVVLYVNDWEGDK